jgi:hypothetical protein
MFACKFGLAKLFRGLATNILGSKFFLRLSDKLLEVRMFDKHYGQPVHCVEITSGRNLTGTVEIYADKIRAEIFSYNGLFHLDEKKPIYFRLHTGEFVSFHSNFSSGSGQTFNRSYVTFNQRVSANLAVVGHNRWTENDKVKSVAFSVDHTMNLMRNSAKYGKILEDKFSEEETLTVFRDRTGDLGSRLITSN